MKMKLILSAGIFLVLSGLAMSLGTDDLRGQEGSDTPRNVELTNRAWKAFEDMKYEDAIAAAGRCVGRFKKEADASQAELEQKKARPQPTGKVNPNQKKAIFDQGLLNDVATCYWVEGRSAQLLKRNDEARVAYNATMKYSYARTWDSRGWFWAPAEDAADRLLDLK